MSSTTRRRHQDRFGHQARADGFPARSVYKLQEIDKKVRLLRKGFRVLDLGAFPGSWTMYAAQAVGPQGSVVGLDLQPFRGALPANAKIHVADLLTTSPEDFAAELGFDDGAVLGSGGPNVGKPFDVVLTDMAPRTTGQRHLDQYRSFELFMQAIRWADALLKTRGSFVGKIFQGPEFQEARAALSERFAMQRIIKPEASRSESYEVFLVGLDKRENGS